MKAGIKYTKFKFPNQIRHYKGKVRDVYFLTDKLIVIASDRISAFDVVLPNVIPVSYTHLTLPTKRIV